MKITSTKKSGGRVKSSRSIELVPSFMQTSDVEDCLGWFQYGKADERREAATHLINHFLACWKMHGGPPDEPLARFASLIFSRLRDGESPDHVLGWYKPAKNQSLDTSIPSDKWLRDIELFVEYENLLAGGKTKKEARNAVMDKYKVSLKSFEATLTHRKRMSTANHKELVYYAAHDRWPRKTKP